VRFFPAAIRRQDPSKWQEHASFPPEKKFVNGGGNNVFQTAIVAFG
jgi:hypothetical protein